MMTWRSTVKAKAREILPWFYNIGVHHTEADNQLEAQVLIKGAAFLRDGVDDQVCWTFDVLTYSPLFRVLQTTLRIQGWQPWWWTSSTLLRRLAQFSRRFFPVKSLELLFVWQQLWYVLFFSFPFLLSPFTALCCSWWIHSNRHSARSPIRVWYLFESFCRFFGHATSNRPTSEACCENAGIASCLGIHQQVRISWSFIGECWSQDKNENPSAACGVI